jgi:hypothetical protein
MLSRYFLLGVFISFSHLMYGSTLVTANISCQIIDSTTGSVVFNDSHGLTITDPSTHFDQPVNLGCTSPYGSVVEGSRIQSRISLGSFGGDINTDLDKTLSFEPSGPQFAMSALDDIRISQQQTFIATGASGIGFLTGMNFGTSLYDDQFPAVIAFLKQIVTTPFGSCNTCGDAVGSFSYQFTFGQPFTLDVEAELTIMAKQFAGYDFGIVGADVGLSAGFSKVVDANGNPIPGATFAAVPETGTWLLTLAGILLIALRPRRGVSKTPAAFPK